MEIPEKSTSRRKRGGWPRTLTGKRQSRNNALQHGLRADELFLPSEDPDIFAKLHAGLREELRPEGVVEDFLVLKLAWSAWRYLRLVKAETAEIASAALSIESNRLLQQYAASQEPNISGGLIRDFSNPIASQRVIELLKNLRTNFEQRGFDEEQDIATLERIYGRHLDVGLPANYLPIARLASDPERCKERSRKPEDLRKETLEAIDEEIGRIEGQMADAAKIESQCISSSARAILVPPSIDRFIRYGAHLDRSFARTLGEYLQLKDMRRRPSKASQDSDTCEIGRQRHKRATVTRFAVPRNDT
jgi:hypothetical protein